MSRKDSFIADQRGAVAFEMIVIWLFLMFLLLLPLADVAIAAFQYISAHGALRAFGQYIQYDNPNNPLDPANPLTWKSGLQTTVEGYTIGNIQVMCGDASTGTVCSSSNLVDSAGRLTAKYFTFSTTLTLSPMTPMTRAVLCPSTCTYTLTYSERYQ
jgi:hypothetical protein